MNQKTSHLVVILSAIIFCILAFLVFVEWSPLVTLDLAFKNAITPLYTYDLTVILIGLSLLTGAVAVTGYSAVAALMLYHKERHNIRVPLFFFLSVGLTSLAVVFLKEIFEIARPARSLLSETGYSFPSGHSAASFAFAYTATIVLTLRKFSWSEKATALVLFIIAFAVGFSRIYLGVHRLSEVVAGFALAALIVSVMYLTLFYKKL